MTRTWKYASRNGNGFVDAGDGLEVVCSDAGATKIKLNNLEKTVDMKLAEFRQYRS